MSVGASNEHPSAAATHSSAHVLKSLSRMFLRALIAGWFALSVVGMALAMRFSVTPPATTDIAAASSQRHGDASEASAPPDSPVRSVDFANFTYPRTPETERTFTLKNGREPTDDSPNVLVNVIYGDVTGDGDEEALVVHTMRIRGSAIPYFVYVYTMRLQRPRMLWSFYAGERGDGGLRQLYAENGELVVELYGRNRVVNRESSNLNDQIGLCCPKFFTRSRYRLRGGRFRQRGREEVLSNPLGGAAYLPLLGKAGRLRK